MFASISFPERGCSCGTAINAISRISGKCLTIADWAVALNTRSRHGHAPFVGSDQTMSFTRISNELSAIGLQICELVSCHWTRTDAAIKCKIFVPTTAQIDRYANDSFNL
uniref:Uncharacterized protein n=1 Tax=Pristionchus pacificus TaxID=54126 RepID=A0A2A6CRI3_PRIPA|eukprot:PDM80730.1 hypothetical protein PRIPAC_35733 [Pristionchus pacificus]